MTPEGVTTNGLRVLLFGVPLLELTPDYPLSIRSSADNPNLLQNDINPCLHKCFLG